MWNLKDKKIVIMGAGTRGKRLLRFCRNKGLRVLGFIDNDQKKWGGGGGRKNFSGGAFFYMVYCGVCSGFALEYCGTGRAG